MTALLLWVCPGTPEARYSFVAGYELMYASRWGGITLRLAEPPVCKPNPDFGIGKTWGRTSDCSCDITANSVSL